MKIGILGGGHVGSALGLSWTRKGHEVLFGVRNPAAPEMTAILASAGGKAHAGSAAEAAGFGNVVVNALPWPATKDILSNLNLANKVLLDCCNPFKPDLSGLEVGGSTSAGECADARTFGGALGLAGVSGRDGREFAFQLIKR